ncbi:hypothetical protein [Sphingomonas sp.]|uniref:hypothetical protein n=1 Tax=Sphingomonas sp. TaxID=28214 RepID=UPI0025D42A00|nr:hypothetical protein [Sphingomonas sp.]
MASESHCGEEFKAEIELAEVTPAALEVITLLNRTWPVYEMAVAEFLVNYVKGDVAEARIMTSHLTTDGKLQKLLLLATHHGRSEDEQLFGKIGKLHKSMAATRNVVVHCPLLGVYRPDPTKVVFLKGRFITGTQLTQVSIVRVAKVLAVARFASVYSEVLIKATCRMTSGSLPIKA